MNKTRIEWVRNPDGSPGYSWNPIKGICPVGCWYCYARKIYKRFKKDDKPCLANEKEFFSPVNSWKARREKARIFVCSTFELFHPIADKWRDQIFQVIEMDYTDTFIILTKMPERIDRTMPDNVWLGVSVTERTDLQRISLLHVKQPDLKFKFVSFEPLLSDTLGSPNGLFRRLNWVIIGRLTGHGHRFDPNKKAIKSIVRAARLWNVPIFLKNNLREIWGEPLIQQFPAGK